MELVDFSLIHPNDLIQKDAERLMVNAVMGSNYREKEYELVAQMAIDNNFKSLVVVPRILISDVCKKLNKFDTFEVKVITSEPHPDMFEVDKNTVFVVSEGIISRFGTAFFAPYFDVLVFDFYHRMYNSKTSKFYEYLTTIRDNSNVVIANVHHFRDQEEQYEFFKWMN